MSFPRQVQKNGKFQDEARGKKYADNTFKKKKKKSPTDMILIKIHVGTAEVPR